MDDARSLGLKELKREAVNARLRIALSVMVTEKFVWGKVS